MSEMIDPETVAAETPAPPGLPPDVRASLAPAREEPVPVQEDEAKPLPEIRDKISLGGEHWARLRQPNQLRAKHTREAMDALQSGKGVVGFAAALVKYVVVEWNLTDEYGRPLPPPDKPTLKVPDPMGEITPVQMSMLIEVGTRYYAHLYPDAAFDEYRSQYDTPPTGASGIS